MFSTVNRTKALGAAARRSSARAKSDWPERKDAGTAEEKFCVHWDSERRWLVVQWDIFIRYCAAEEMTSLFSKIDRPGGQVYLDWPTDARSFLRRYASGESRAADGAELIGIRTLCDGPVSFFRSMPALATEE